ncbi:MAG TPA: PaaI family thioesterase [Acidimicrobiales bacterium]|nr:PaaI family thioesterase [Acidimicrobiales bacterium]
MTDPAPQVPSPPVEPPPHEPSVAGAAQLPTPGSPGWPHVLGGLHGDEPDARRRELHRTGEALRRILHRLHASPAPPHELAAAADELERLGRRLDAFPNGSLYEGFGESPLAGPDPHAFFDHSPMLGRANPLAPPLELTMVDGEVRCEATFGPAYEGPPGCVHGGYIAAAFDEVLGSAQSLAGRAGMTARLTVNYRSPTPLEVVLHFRGRVVGVEGRKTFTEGTLHAGDRLCAEGEALFVAVDFPRIDDMRRRREEARGPDAAG